MTPEEEKLAERMSKTLDHLELLVEAMNNAKITEDRMHEIAAECGFEGRADKIIEALSRPLEEGTLQ